MRRKRRTGSGKWKKEGGDKDGDAVTITSMIMISFQIKVNGSIPNNPFPAQCGSHVTSNYYDSSMTHFDTNKMCAILAFQWIDSAHTVVIELIIFTISIVIHFCPLFIASPGVNRSDVFRR